MGLTMDPNNAPYIDGDMTSIRIIQAEFPPPGSNLVIDPSRTFEVEVKWELRGFYAPLWLAGLAPADWSVAAYAESLGPGPEVILAEETEPRLNFTLSPTGAHQFTHTMTVAASTLQESNPGNPAGPSGVYKVVASVFLNSNLGAPGFDVTGYIEGPVVRVENPN